MLVADGERAVLIDPPFEPRWWDTRAHPLRSRLRGPGFPEHNVSCALRGPIVTDLHDVFRGLWDARAAASRDGEAALAPAPRPQPPAGPLAAQLTFTTPRGRRTVLESYQRALLEARRWAYVENQYFTSYNIRAAVRRALDANPRLEVILLLNERPDTPTYPAWQDRRLRELGWPDEPRLGVFSPWQVGSDSMGHVEARPIYVHSKVAIVDDAWATTGSANLDDIALDTAREWGFLDKRSIEVNLAMLDGIAGFPRTGDVARLRRTLWSEHLGEEEAALADEPQGGWLARWRARAQQNLAAIERGEPRIRGYLLPHHARLPRRVRVLGPRTRGA
jgi:phosphatidylserine/phosphatidylglycerophosphate/cardiolipin synthase-like enzyme